MDTSWGHGSGATPGLDLRVLLTSGVRGGPRADTASWHLRSLASRHCQERGHRGNFSCVYFAFSTFYSESVFLQSDNDRYINDIDGR